MLNLFLLSNEFIVILKVLHCNQMKSSTCTVKHYSARWLPLSLCSCHVKNACFCLPHNSKGGVPISSTMTQTNQSPRAAELLPGVLDTDSTAHSGQSLCSRRDLSVSPRKRPSKTICGHVPDGVNRPGIVPGFQDGAPTVPRRVAGVAPNDLLPWRTTARAPNGSVPRDQTPWKRLRTGPGFEYTTPQ